MKQDLDKSSRSEVEKILENRSKARYVPTEAYDKLEHILTRCAARFRDGVIVTQRGEASGIEYD